jgi:hypothetical protein
MFTEIHRRSFLRPQPLQQECALYTRDNFKANRAAALSDWRQICSA